MTSIFTTIPPPQNFETIRDQIGVVLAFELATLAVLDTNFVAPKIWIERMYQFDSATELPAINITYNNGNYTTKTRKNTRGECIYNVDIYTNSPTVEDDGTTTPGDKLAAIKMQQIAGFVRLILDSPAYLNLGFEDNIVSNNSVQSFSILDKSQAKDALSSIVGRIPFSVTCKEDNQTIDASVIIDGNDTTISFVDSELGCFLRYNQP